LSCRRECTAIAKGGRPAKKFRQIANRKTANLQTKKVSLIIEPSANGAVCGFAICETYLQTTLNNDLFAEVLRPRKNWVPK
jgi:hypothetical protein